AVLLRKPPQTKPPLPRLRAAGRSAQAAVQRGQGLNMTNPAGSLENRAADFFHELQDRITAALEAADGGKFREDQWTRPTGGGGRTRALEGGALFEKAGVAVSDVHGTLRPEMAAALPGEGDEFRATGLSLIFHPRSPRIPTVHANVRHIRRGSRSWFGGGTDLTPYYVVA